MSLHIVAALGYVIYGALIYGVLLAAAAYSRDWFGFRILTVGAMAAWASYCGLMILCLRDDGAEPLAPWIARAQRVLAGVSILLPAAYVLRALVRS